MSRSLVFLLFCTPHARTSPFLLFLVCRRVVPARLFLCPYLKYILLMSLICCRDSWACFVLSHLIQLSFQLCNCQSVIASISAPFYLLSQSLFSRFADDAQFSFSVSEFDSCSLHCIDVFVQFVDRVWCFNHFFVCVHDHVVCLGV